MLRRHVFANPRLATIAFWTRIGYGARPDPLPEVHVPEQPIHFVMHPDDYTRAKAVELELGQRAGKRLAGPPVQL